MNVAIQFIRLILQIFAKKICHSGPLSPEPRSSCFVILWPNLGPGVKPQDDIGEVFKFFILKQPFAFFILRL